MSKTGRLSILIHLSIADREVSVPLSKLVVKDLHPTGIEPVLDFSCQLRKEALYHLLAMIKVFCNQSCVHIQEEESSSAERALFESRTDIMNGDVVHLFEQHVGLGDLLCRLLPSKFVDAFSLKFGIPLQEIHP